MQPMRDDAKHRLHSAAHGCIKDHRSHCSRCHGAAAGPNARNDLNRRVNGGSHACRCYHKHPRAHRRRDRPTAARRDARQDVERRSRAGTHGLGGVQKRPRQRHCRRCRSAAHSNERESVQLRVSAGVLAHQTPAPTPPCAPLPSPPRRRAPL